MSQQKIYTKRKSL